MFTNKQQFFCVSAVFLAINVLFFLWHAVSYRRVRSAFDQYEQERQQVRKQPTVLLEADVSIEEEDLFMLLNRTPDYLRDTAISFARSYDLGDSVMQLYTKSALEPEGPKQPTNKKKKKVLRPRQRRQFSEVDYARWDTQKKVEPIFDLPIDRNQFWLSSPFGVRRKPGGGRQFHFGIDMAAVRGTPVKAAGSGAVVQAGHQAGYGNVIVIKHDGKFKTRYAHLSKIVVRVGAQVKAEQVIGNVGSTGNARASGKTRDASHLHFEVEMYEKRVNPFYFFK